MQPLLSAMDSPTPARPHQRAKIIPAPIVQIAQRESEYARISARPRPQSNWPTDNIATPISVYRLSQRISLESGTAAEPAHTRIRGLATSAIVAAAGMPKASDAMSEFLNAPLIHPQSALALASP